MCFLHIWKLIYTCTHTHTKCVIINNLGNGIYYPLELMKNNSPMYKNEHHVMISKEIAKNGTLGWVGKYKFRIVSYLTTAWMLLTNIKDA